MSGLDTKGLEQWLADMRPRLHSFCGRMMGSAIDGEDVVQEALIRAATSYERSAPIASPEAWLFRIARNAAIDMMRQRRGGDVPMLEGDDADPGADSAARVAVTLGFTAFLPLPPPQRASVVLVDVLGYSAAETASILETSVAAVKAALHRGRLRLAVPAESPAPAIDDREKLQLRAYADLFNARAFDALRDLLAADAQLDLPPRAKRKGKADVSIYFERYSAADIAWRVEPVLAEGRPALLATDPDNANSRFVILLGWSDGRIVTIRDFHYARYVMDGIDIARI
ncbi:MAG TPA: sigma-70 family RNA polymerase sigma factor [Sphingomonas sp.]|uniref:sigma-70 family RNA polymerase sigma factor n=1 Tax=Sphingomonas sp. TaxID=28214 RepID=UPI002CDAA444|nr:sigma-70 family RNA polymerase sigma factor [Sphingomonas sp.]HMI18358.1 sigma-70 family RNA polymerase sigma factor [Sphingomonas sp.]